MASFKEQSVKWPDCLSFVAIEVDPPHWMFTWLLSEELHLKVFSISGGQLQYSFHPNLTAGRLREITNDGADISREWTLEHSEKLDGFTYDPRDKKCTGHKAMLGGLLEAEIEVHGPKEITITSKLEPKPLQIRFLSAETATKVQELIKLNAACCQQKLMENAAAQHVGKAEEA